jgi:threonine aldolase
MPPHFTAITKQNGALLAKGRLLGIQFDTLFTDGLYDKIGENAIRMADQVRAALRAKGYEQGIENPTNQVFLIVENDRQAQLARQVELAFMERVDAQHVMMRIATSWATSQADIDRLIALL